MPLRDYEDEIITPEIARQVDQYGKRKRTGAMLKRILKTVLVVSAAATVVVAVVYTLGDYSW